VKGAIFMKTLRDIMTTQVVTVTLQDNIYEIASKMKEHGIGLIPVVEGKKVIGVVTDRDLVIRGYANKHSGSTAVEEVMTSECVKVSPDTTVDEAAKIMGDKKIRRLVVEQNGELAGIVAIGDLALRRNFENEAGDALSHISEPGRELAGTVK
jgi:CBS domain-containing protein